MGNKVICGVCLNQSAGFCSFKKHKVKLKKRRMCDRFKKDVDKIGFKQPIPTVRRPDWHWLDKKERKKVLKEMLAEAQKQMARRPSAATANTNNTQHPLTGDLSRFTTTATKEEKEKKNDG